ACAIDGKSGSDAATAACSTPRNLTRLIIMSSCDLPAVIRRSIIPHPRPFDRLGVRVDPSP
ncbi:MAG TPA: hypothetical protein VIY09_08170, partial [Rhizomicrobium sp.]